MTLLLPSCFSSKAEWAGWQPQGSFVQRVQSPPQGPHRVHTGSTSPLFYAALTYTKAHVAMCDRALGGFPWLLISILTPLSHFLCGNKSHTKVHMWIYSWVRQEIRNLLTFYWDIYLKLIVEKHNGMCLVTLKNIGRYFKTLTKYCNFCWFFWSFEKKCHQKWRKHRVIIL